MCQHFCPFTVFFVERDKEVDSKEKVIKLPYKYIIVIKLENFVFIRIFFYI